MPACRSCRRTLLFAPAFVFAQARSGMATERLLAAQRFEEAREAGDAAGALALARVALALTPADDAQGTEDRIDLPRGVAQSAGTARQACGLRGLPWSNSSRASRRSARQRRPVSVPASGQALATRARGCRPSRGGRSPCCNGCWRSSARLYARSIRTCLATLDAVGTIRVRVMGAHDTCRGKIDRESHVAQREQPGRSAVAAERGKERRYALQDGFATVRLYYGTNRRALGSDGTRALLRQGARRARARLRGRRHSGEIHKEGELETQSRWSMLGYFVRRSCARAALRADPESRAAAAGGSSCSSCRARCGLAAEEIFVFVHGFNTQLRRCREAHGAARVRPRFRRHAA